MHKTLHIAAQINFERQFARKDYDSAWPSFQSQAACEESAASCKLAHLSPSVSSQACIFSKLIRTQTDSKGRPWHRFCASLHLSSAQSSCFDLLRKKLPALCLVPRKYQLPSANASDAKHGCRSAWTWVQELRWPSGDRLVWRKHANIIKYLISASYKWTTLGDDEIRNLRF